MDDRIIQVEQLIKRLDAKLGQTQQQLQRAESRARRATRRDRILMACTAIALAMLGAGTASAGSGPRPLTVQAPFKVVSSTGQPLMTVTDVNGGQIHWFDAHGKEAGNAGSGANGKGRVEVGPPGANFAQLGYSGGKLGLRFFQDGQMVAGLGESPLGGAVELNTPSGTRLVYLGESALGGEVSLNATDGTERAFLGVDAAGVGSAEITKADGSPAAELTEHSDGGYFVLTNTAGIARVEGGVTARDTGDMRVFGPKGFDYIQGRG